MTEFRYVQITLVIILSLGMTEILRNIANQIRSRKEIEVYVRKVNDTFHFTINGGFGNISGKLPMSKTEAQRILDIGTDYNRLAKKPEGQKELSLVGNSPGLPDY